jgi:DNA-binding GntR family transcriptional regulator
MKPLQSTPGLGQQAYQAILDSICNGTLAAGTHLVQEQLAAQLGVSRQPIQQALALLKADGMIEDVGKRGLRVTTLDVELMRDHYDIRAVLDGLAARRAAETAVEKDKADDIHRRGSAILAAGRNAIAADDVADMIRHDEAFHNLVYEASENPLLARTAEVHWRFLRRVMGEVLRRAEPPTDIWQQHEDILSAIVSANAALAERLAIDHVQRATHTLSAALAATAKADASSQGSAP